MRAVKTVISAAGNLKRENAKMNEVGLGNFKNTSFGLYQCTTERLIHRLTSMFYFFRTAETANDRVFFLKQ